MNEIAPCTAPGRSCTDPSHHHTLGADVLDVLIGAASRRAVTA